MTYTGTPQAMVPRLLPNDTQPSLLPARGWPVGPSWGQLSPRPLGTSGFGPSLSSGSIMTFTGPNLHPPSWNPTPGGTIVLSFVA